MKLPHKLLKILEGESLLNDTSALLVYRLAIMTVMAGHIGFGGFAPVFLLTVFGSLAAGMGCAFALQPLMSRLRDVPISLIVQFACTFGVWIAAEAIGLSGILTLVAFAMTMARRGGPLMPARMRVPIFAVWETVVFVLNAFAFVLIGMQLRPIWERLDAGGARTEAVVTAAVVLGTLVLQGLTIKPLIRRMGLTDDDPVGREVWLGRAQAYKALIDAIKDDDSLAAKLLRKEYDAVIELNSSQEQDMWSTKSPVGHSGAALSRPRDSARSSCGATTSSATTPIEYSCKNSIGPS